jgi:hypothetical protein
MPPFSLENMGVQQDSDFGITIGWQLLVERIIAQQLDIVTPSPSAVEPNNKLIRESAFLRLRSISDMRSPAGKSATCSGFTGSFLLSFVNMM